jgi:hypothetical protein
MGNVVFGGGAEKLGGKWAVQTPAQLDELLAKNFEHQVGSINLSGMPAATRHAPRTRASCVVAEMQLQHQIALQ